jgi:hypothetical protein
VSAPANLRSSAIVGVRSTASNDEEADEGQRDGEQRRGGR